MDQSDSNERDEALVAELRTAVAKFDPVPAQVLAAAYGAFEFRDLDGQLAALIRDSANETAELAGVRGALGRLLTFALGERYVEVEVTADGDHRIATGYVVPADAGAVTAESSSGRVDGEVDAQGRFRLVGLTRGPMRLRFEVGGRPALLTPWSGI